MIARLLKSARLAGTTDVVVIGAGHAGLAASYCLGEQGIDHVVLERGEVANSWKNERWDSLKLLTPNWQTCLPGFSYCGDDPDGFMNMPEVVEFIEHYARFADAPVRTHTRVTAVRRHRGGYRVVTNRGQWQAKAVIIASGACNTSSVPKVAENIPARVRQLTPHQYRGPQDVPPGGVLVVGASATGLQLADELQRAGHDVTIAAGEHVRMPRTYRGHDIQFWMDRTRIMNERYDEVDDIVRARGLPSPQLVGSREPGMLDLNYLQKGGAKVVGRLMGINNGTAQFSGSLRNVCALADLKLNRLLDGIDSWVLGNSVLCEAPERFDATQVDASPSLTLKLDDGSIRTVIWATGFRPDYSWLDVPVLDRKGRLQHEGGVVDAPGLYALGLPMMRRRKSSFMYGIEDDARDITDHLVSFLDAASVRPAA
ncbi:MAG: NAD(P)-binding domain-containing protein [Gammaproteobacteria bacterium]|nr:NAD(P)-binding domain-containing protein [Gammaproteobacteria bacterium]